MKNIFFYSKSIGKERPKYRLYQRTICKWKNGIGESSKHILSRFDLLENASCSFMICLCVHKQQYFQEEKSKKGSMHKGMGL